MSNKLDEYRESFLEDVAPFDHETNYGNNRFRKGFDAAIALNLPVKFEVWRQDYFHSDIAFKIWVKEKLEDKPQLTTEEWVVLVYKYWLDNIYKLES